MDGVTDIRKGIEKMDLVRNATKEEEAGTSAELTEKTEIRKEEKEKRKEEREKKGQEEEERSTEKKHALSKNKIRKLLKRLLHNEVRRSRGRGGGRRSGWRRGGRGGNHPGWRRGGMNKNYFIINQNR
nr:PREDICTED: glutamic acid-rich protein-like [Megachile rotundata]